MSLLAYVGMQPGDVNFVEIATPLQAFLDGKADAVHTQGQTGPFLHGLKDNPGHIILSTSIDKPWSQYYCCMLYANRDWAKANPVATKRATRAILRATDAAKRDLHAAAKAAIEKGTYKASPLTTEQLIYDVMKDQSFEWRDFDPEDTVRFFALRLADAKLVKKTPTQIIAEGTDFAYFRRLQKELKA